MGESSGVPVPGETALITAAVLASQGKLKIELVIPLAAAGAIVGDNIGYLIGRKGGRWLLERPGASTASAARCCASASRSSNATAPRRCSSGASCSACACGRRGSRAPRACTGARSCSGTRSAASLGDGDRPDRLLPRQLGRQRDRNVRHLRPGRGGRRDRQRRARCTAAHSGAPATARRAAAARRTPAAQAPAVAWTRARRRGRRRRAAGGARRTPAGVRRRRRSSGRRCPRSSAAGADVDRDAARLALLGLGDRAPRARRRRSCASMPPGRRPRAASANARSGPRRARRGGSRPCARSCSDLRSPEIVSTLSSSSTLTSSSLDAREGRRAARSCVAVLDQVHRRDPARAGAAVAAPVGRVEDRAEQAVHLLLDRLQLARGLPSDECHLLSPPMIDGLSVLNYAHYKI